MGKGSKRRPTRLSEEEMAARWARVFEKKKAANGGQSVKSPG